MASPTALEVRTPTDEPSRLSGPVHESHGAGETGRAGRNGRIAIARLGHSYGKEGEEILRSIDLDIAPGSFVSLVGASGCGKTTLLKLVAGFEPVTSGVISVDGTAVSAPGGDRAVVFQHANLLPWLSVRKNIELGPRLGGVGRRERRRIADELLDLVGLDDSGDLATWELSGGMQQRCAIARALATDPTILLMDEPFAALDAITRERLQDEILRIWRQRRMTVIFVTHSVDEALYLSTRVIAMAGRPGGIVLDVPLKTAADDEGPIARREARSSVDANHTRTAIRQAILGA